MGEVLRRWGAAIRSHRRALDLSQARLAEVAGLDQTAVSQAERGVIQLSLRSRLKLAAALGVAHDDLFSVDRSAAA